MSGGGFDEGGPGILETPPLFLAIVFTFFLVVTLGFEALIHHARHALLRRKKAGLVAALDKMTGELMLLGVATLLLTAVERSVAGACVPAKDLGLTVWADFVNGCACCLSRTAGLSECFLRDKQCGSAGAVEDCCAGLPPGRGRTCPVETIAAALLDAGHGGGGGGGRALLAGGKGVDSSSSEVHFCEGAIESGISGCPPGKRPAISVDAMHQVHIFIFVLALVHVAAGVAVAILSSARVRAWAGWDRAAERVERGLFRQACAAAAVSAADERAAAASAAAAKAGAAAGGGAAVAAAAPPPAAAAAGSDVEAGVPAPAPPARGGPAGRALARSVGRSGGAPTPAPPSLGPPRPSDAGGGGGGGTPPPFLAPAASAGGATTPTTPTPDLPDRFVPPTYLGPHAGDRPWRGRPGDLGPSSPAAAHAKEAAWCFLMQFAPDVVTKREWHIMRASFLDTHRVGAHRGRPFDFAAYTASSVDDDFASVVGLGLPTWLLLVGFVLLSAAIGWAVWVLVAVAGAVLLVVNWKLVSIVRHVTRGGAPHELDPAAFWLGRPWLMLPAIKAAIFLIALLWANTIFFATEFGRDSCFFSPTGFQRAAPAPWWAVLAVSVALFLIIALNTMPMFSLTVQMGADVKADLIPEGLRGHFAAVGAELAARRASRAASRTKLSRALSARLPRRADGLSRSGHGDGGGSRLPRPPSAGGGLGEGSVRGLTRS